MLLEKGEAHITNRKADGVAEVRDKLHNDVIDVRAGICQNFHCLATYSVY